MKKVRKDQEIQGKTLVEAEQGTDQPLSGEKLEDMVSKGKSPPFFYIISDY